MRAVKIILRTLLFTIIGVVVLTALFFLYFTVIDFQPPPLETIENGKPTGTAIDWDEFSFLTWNIGYCGLDRKMDFFYDGGKKVRPTDSSFQHNLNGVFGFLSEQDTMDFIFLQEVDTLAKRSYYANEAALFSDALPNHVKSFATNYKVRYVPMPVLNPMGDVISGIATYSRPRPEISQRYSFPVNYAWPLKLFMLDRCFIMQRLKLKNGHELVVMNTHNSAFENADVLRQYEMWMLRSFVLQEYAMGNYVVLGGDWNENPPGYDRMKYYSCYHKKSGLPEIPEDYLPEDWHWAYDRKIPTNRDVDEAFRPGFTPTTTIDFFVTSPNVTVEYVKTMDCGFEFSDHQPVFMRVKLESDPLKSCSEDCRDIISELQDSLKVFKEGSQKKVKKKKVRH
jgi:endonuclease/exonuclease/phosphatase family metal-dependent hydrolase